MYELLIEKTENGFRAILFETFEDLKSVVDILENCLPWLWAEGENSFVTNYGTFDEVKFDKSHKNTNFGNAKKFGSMSKKICEQL